MRWCSLWILLLVGSTSTPASAALKPRYVAVFRDGHVATSDQTPSWHETSNGARFAGERLFDTEPELLLLRDRESKAERTSPYLVLSNGDVLPGVIVGYEAGNAQFGHRPTLYVTPEGALEPMQGERLAIRADRVQRIVATTQPPAALTENTVVLTDGRKFAPRSLRFTPYGLSILTDAGVVTANFAEVAAVDFMVNREQAVLEDSLFAGNQPDTRLVRLATKDGAILTGAKMFRYTLRDNGRRARNAPTRTLVVLQPAWALEAISVLDSEILQSSFRKPNELPLSLLNMSTLAQRSVLGTGIAWQRNATVAGQPLASGELEADWGIGTHAHNEVTVELPAAAQTLQTWVGLERAMGSGGCIVGKIRRESSTGEELWSSGMLRGGDAPRNTGELPIAGTQRVVLVTEMGHAGRPAGADPFDVRDHAVWLSPIVKIDTASILTPGTLAGLLGGWQDWRVDRQELQQARFAGVWNGQSNRWDPLLRIDADRRLTLRRSVAVTPQSDVVELVVATPLQPADHDFELVVDGQTLPLTTSEERQHASSVAQRRANQPLRADNGRRAALREDSLCYWWDLQAFRGRTVEVELRMKGPRGGAELIWRSLSLRGAVSNLPAAGKLPVAEVPLTSLRPLEAAEGNAANLPTQGYLPLRGKPALTFVGQAYRDGYALAKNQRLSFAVAPEHRKFVTLAGASLGEAGPLRVLMNDRVVWETPLRSSTAGAEWIELPIPVGTVKLTLEAGGEASYLGFAAFTNAGLQTTAE